MKKIRTHKDAFKAYLAPEEYGLDPRDGCIFCEATDSGCDRCRIGFYCGGGNDINGVCWPVVSKPQRKEIIQHLIRNCKNWRLENIERVARKKAIALGYKFKKAEACS